MRIADKTVKRIVGFVSVSFVVWSAVFITDYHRCGKLQEPVFALRSGTDTGEGGAATVYKGLGYRVEVEKDREDNIISVTMVMFGKVISASIT